MGPYSRRDSYVDNGEDEVDMAEREETNKKDRGVCLPSSMVNDASQEPVESVMERQIINSCHCPVCLVILPSSSP